LLPSPSTYFDHQAKRADPDLLSDRPLRDALLLPEIKRVHKAHFQVCGAQKLWHELGRDDFSVARCTVVRRMRTHGIEGAVRGKPQPHFSVSAPTAPSVHFPTMLHRSIAKTISDQCVKPCWKNRPTLKLWREFVDSERKRRNVPLEHHQGHQKKLCFQGGLGGRLGH
jgi:transposase InsO family protein